MIRLVRYFLLALCLGLLASCSDVPNDAGVSNETKPLKVFVLAGQSNMLGRRSNIDELPDHLQARQEGNLIFSEGLWIPLEPGVYQEAGLGPELSFAYQVSQALGEPVGIIKHSRGGTDLAVEWAPDNPESLYPQLVGKIEDARAEKEFEILGMTWMQGESDSEDTSMASSYGENLANLVASTRKDFGGPDMVFVAGRINPPLVERYADAEKVRSAQSNNEIDRYDYVDCDGLTKLPDDLHYDTLGTVKLGELMAEKALALLQSTGD